MNVTFIEDFLRTCSFQLVVHRWQSEAGQRQNRSEIGEREWEQGWIQWGTTWESGGDVEKGKTKWSTGKVFNMKQQNIGQLGWYNHLHGVQTTIWHNKAHERGLNRRLKDIINTEQVKGVNNNEVRKGTTRVWDKTPWWQRSTWWTVKSNPSKHTTEKGKNGQISPEIWQ